MDPPKEEAMEDAIVEVDDGSESGEVLTVDEAALLLRVSRWALYRAIKGGRLPAGRVGGSIRLSRAALLAWLSTPATKPKRRR